MLLLLNLSTHMQQSIRRIIQRGQVCLAPLARNIALYGDEDELSGIGPKTAVLALPTVNTTQYVMKKSA